MAEFVQQVVEKSIHSLSVLEKYGLFESSEIKTILNKRRDFEYCLRKVNKTKDDFLRYISYEENLLKLIRIRRDKLGIEIDKFEIEKSFVEHIKKLFEFTLHKFKFDISLWLSYIDFVKNQRMLDHVSIIYFRMLQIHNKDWLWIQFAKFEFEERASSETARKIFLRCLNFHADSPRAYLEYFRFELLYCAKIRKRFKLFTDLPDNSDKLGEISEKQSKDAIWNGQLAYTVYKHAKEVIPDFEFASKFIDICNKVDFETCKEVKRLILEDLQLRFESNEAYWNLLARNRFNEYRQQLRSFVHNEEEKQAIKQKAWHETIGIFEQACLHFDNQTMWEYYLTFRLERISEDDNSSYIADSVSEWFLLLDKLWSRDRVSEKIYHEWVNLLVSCLKSNGVLLPRVVAVLLEAGQRWPTSLEMHLFVAAHLITLPNSYERVVQNFFDDALVKKFTVFNEDNADLGSHLWELYIDWSVQRKVRMHKMKSVLNHLDSILVRCPRRMSEYFKSKILSLIYHVFGIQKARTHYEKNKSVYPITKAYFYKMIEIENHFAETQEEFEDLTTYSIVSSIFNDLTHHFGTHDAQIWLDYIEYGVRFDVSKISLLYHKALKSLDSTECHQFVQKYSLFKSNWKDNFN